MLLLNGIVMTERQHVNQTTHFGMMRISCGKIHVSTRYSGVCQVMMMRIVEMMMCTIKSVRYPTCVEGDTHEPD